MNKEWLFGKTVKELEEIVLGLKQPKFRAKQIASWLYKKEVETIEQMTDLSEQFRKTLAEKYQVGRIEDGARYVSKDGTVKYIFPTIGNSEIEAVYIPDRERATLCVSSQAGCKMGCKFCMTGRGGFKHHLSTGEILNQIRNVGQISPLTNLVYMGMGEPLDNTDAVLRSLEILTASWGYGMSPTRITLSTIGVIPNLKRFIEQCKVHLAISLHSPFADQRCELMPVEKAYPIESVLELIKEYDFSHQRRVSFEYIMFKGLTDSDSHITALLKLLKGLKCRVNLIRFHKIPDSSLTPSPIARMEQFRDKLSEKGVITTIRSSRGEDILAACGMLGKDGKTKAEC